MDVKKVFATVAKAAKKADTEVYVVGGFVRDALLKIEERKDIDFVVVGSGVAFAKSMFETVGEEGASLIEFPDFDTARIVFGERNTETGSMERIDIEIEFAGARSESYRSTSRKPVVKPATLEEDLSRRDFTVNAMAQKVGAAGKLGKIIDPFNGQEDLKNGILKTPLDPDITFSDDPLRMLRAARFAAQLSFNIEPETFAAMKRNAERLKIISPERIQEEFFKLLAAPRPSIGLWALIQSDLLAEFLPEINALGGVEDMYGHSHKDNLSHTIQVVDNIAERSENVLLRFAGLLHDIGKPGTKEFLRGRGWTFDMHEHLGKKMVRDIGKRLHMSKADTEYIAKLVRWHMQPINLMDEGVTDSAVRRLIVNLGADLEDQLILCRSDITTGNPNKKERRLKNYDYLEKRIGEVIEIDKLRAFQSPVRGEEVMELCGLKPGPTVGKIKSALEEAILDGKVANEYEAVKQYFLSLKEEFMKDVQAWERVV